MFYYIPAYGVCVCARGCGTRYMLQKTMEHESCHGPWQSVCKEMDEDCVFVRTRIILDTCKCRWRMHICYHRTVCCVNGHEDNVDGILIIVASTIQFYMAFVHRDLFIPTCEITDYSSQYRID